MTTDTFGRQPFALNPLALQKVLGDNGRLTAQPWASLSETLRNAQSNANSLVLHAKENPNVQRIVVGAEETLNQWELHLRQDASKRLGGFKPLQPLYNSKLLADDWDLLKRVNTMNKPLGSPSLKRSASDTSLASPRTDKLALPAPGDEVHSHPAPDQFYHEFTLSKNMSSNISLRGNFPKVHTAPRLDTMTTANAPAAASAAADAAASEEIGAPATPTTSSSGPYRQRRSNSIDTSMGGLEALAGTLVQSSKMALQSAQQSIQETAANCHQNLLALSQIVKTTSQLAMASPPGVGVGGSATDSSSSTALVPWNVFPSVLRARERAALNTDSIIQQEGGNVLAPVQDFLEQHLQIRLPGRAAPASPTASLRDAGRQVAIVTTASLPWMTGTAVNPLLRAAYLAEGDANRKVTLVVPWLSKSDQERIFPNGVTFESPEEQEDFIRGWARQRTGLPCDFKVSFYPGRYAPEKGSILPVGDITSVIPDHEADVAVLEEPEHLTWYHHGKRWTDKFNHVVGVMHTNYLDYARREEGGAAKEMILKHVNAWMCRIHCHKVIKLSDAVQRLPRQETMFVHGVGPSFLRVGERKAQEAATAGRASWGKGAYFIGKVLWAKGYTELLDQLNGHATRTGRRVEVDVYGTGPDLPAVMAAASDRALPLRFNGARDHADESLSDYKVFINPSLSDVVATTTAEALAMGKFVVCADHPSNRFFAQFPNCLIYRTPDEFSRCLQTALESEPRPLSADDVRKLTWEDATERFLDVAHVKQPAMPLERLVDTLLAGLHNTLTGMESLRMAAGAGARTRDMPARITDYVPSDSDVGGFFDDHKRAKQAYEKGKSAAAAKAAAAAPAAAAGSSSTAAGPSLSTSSGAAKSS